MLRVLFVAAIVAGVSAGFGAAWHGAEASPVPVISKPVAEQALLEDAGWRRRWRRQQYAPIVGPDVETDIEVDVAPGGADIIVVRPPRPASCGEYHYWNGAACVDARYNDPYLGPR